MKKRIITSLIVSAISFISLIISLILLLGEKFQIRSCGCPKTVDQNFLFLFIILSIIFIGSLIYALLTIQLNKKEKKVQFNIGTIMKFLDTDEKEIIKQLKKKGEIFQSKIKNLNNLRKHRAIKKLKEKNIVKIKKIKNKNLVKLNKQFEMK
jgi:uncharacterized membrane-anchored protein YhcB (DUF1043 family)